MSTQFGEADRSNNTSFMSHMFANGASNNRLKTTKLTLQKLLSVYYIDSIYVSLFWHMTYVFILFLICASFCQGYFWNVDNIQMDNEVLGYYEC